MNRPNFIDQMNQFNFQGNMHQQIENFLKKSKFEKVAKEMREGLSGMIKEKTQREKRKIAEGLWEGINLTDRTLRELRIENNRLLNKVEPKFCRKCCRRTLQDVENERFENLPLSWSLTSVLERKDVMILLLLIRKYCPDSPFYFDALPLDIFKIILKLSEVCQVVEWKDRVAKKIPDEIQLLLLKENDQDIAKNVVLKGHFHLERYVPDHNGPKKMDYFVKTQNLKPVKQEDFSLLKFRWDDPDNLDWWCEFTITPKNVTLRGRIPKDTKCLGYTNYKDKDLRWTFGSESDKTFWADVYIYN